MEESIIAGIEDVAKMAGVSKALVSRYLNERPGVGPEKKAKIAEAIETLHYRRNDIARSLVQKRTGALGVIMDSLRSPFMFELIRGIEAAGQETGYSILFCDCMSNIKTKLRYTDFLSHNRVDGLVIYGSFMTDEMVANELSKAKFPYILIENDIRDLDVNKVLVDSRAGVRQLVRYFYQKGNRDIGVFCWGLTSHAGMERYQGYLEGMQECGLSIQQERIYNYQEDCSITGVPQLVEKIIAFGTLPEVLLFCADEQAFSAIPVFQQHGIQLPHDIKIAGFDHDFYLSREILMPRLVTVEQPLFEMGHKAVHMLVENIEKSQLPFRTITYPVKLIEGDTG